MKELHRIITKQDGLSIISPFLFFFTNRKKELLSRDDLQLPWRPLYDLYDRVVYSKTEHLGLIWFPKYEVLSLHQPDECGLSIVLVYCIYVLTFN